MQYELLKSFRQKKKKKTYATLCNIDLIDWDVKGIYIKVLFVYLFFWTSCYILSISKLH